MLKFPQALRNLEAEIREAEADAKFGGEWLFAEWRQRYSALLCKAIRHAYAMRASGKLSGVDPGWCNAAALILDNSSDETVDVFLRSKPERKNDLVRAVMSDGGMYNTRDHWVELPPL